MAKRAVSSPLLLDWLPVLVLPPVLVIDAAISAKGKPIDVVNVLAAIVGSLPLVARRRLSFPALAPLLVAGVVLVLWQLHPQNEIAASLVLSPLTVKTHLARLFAKLCARDRAQLVVLAYESGLVVPGQGS